MTLDIRILQFLTTFTQAYARPKKSVFIGLESKECYCKMCQTVRLKWGHTNTAKLTNIFQGFYFWPWHLKNSLNKSSFICLSYVRTLPTIFPSPTQHFRLRHNFWIAMNSEEKKPQHLGGSFNNLLNKKRLVGVSRMSTGGHVTKGR